MTLQTVPSLSLDENSITIIERIIVSSFTAEYFVKMITCYTYDITLLSFFTSIDNIIDLMAILPFYSELVGLGRKFHGLVVLRVLRLTRIFRLFKLSRFSNRLIILKQVMEESKQILFTFVFIVAISVIIFSSIMYLIERGTFDDETQ